MMVVKGLTGSRWTTWDWYLLPIVTTGLVCCLPMLAATYLGTSCQANAEWWLPATDTYLYLLSLDLNIILLSWVVIMVKRESTRQRHQDNAALLKTLTARLVPAFICFYLISLLGLVTNITSADIDYYIMIPRHRVYYGRAADSKPYSTVSCLAHWQLLWLLACTTVVPAIMASSFYLAIKQLQADDARRHFRSASDNNNDNNDDNNNYNYNSGSHTTPWSAVSDLRHRQLAVTTAAIDSII